MGNNKFEITYQWKYNAIYFILTIVEVYEIF